MHTIDEDQLLWRQLREGNAPALGNLLKKYYRILFHYATKFTKDTALAEDCIQDLFLKLWDRRVYLGDTASVKFYLLKALRNDLIKIQQKNYTRGECIDSEIETDPEEHIESRIIYQEGIQVTANKLQIHMARLPKRQREALYLRYYENLSYEEIAQMMSIHPQSVANLLQQSLKKIRECWHYFTLLLLCLLPI